MRPLEARCLLGLGAVLAARSHEQARQHLVEAAGRFAALGIDRWRRQAEALASEIAR